MNESITNTNERLNLLIDTNQETNNITETVPDRIESVPSTEQPDTLRRGSFEVGNRDIVTNKYRGFKGTTGTIVSLSNA